MSAFRFTTARRARPIEGLTACGDAVIEVHADNWHLFAVVDALGHGPDAEKSAVLATKAAEASKGQPLSVVFEAVHRALWGHRGVVMSALLVQGDEFTFAGVGNVELFSPADVARPVAMAGTLGTQRYRFRSFQLPLRHGQRWVLASDGIKARDASTALVDLRAHTAEAAADALLERVTRHNDDASVLVLDVHAPETRP